MYLLLLAVIYIAFISLGLPDSLLGSAWPTIYAAFDVPISYMGIVSMIIAGGTIVSSPKVTVHRITADKNADKIRLKIFISSLLSDENLYINIISFFLRVQTDYVKNGHYFFRRPTALRINYKKLNSFAY